MLLSFLCPTYGRAATENHLISEMVWWFCQRTYADCELVIGNDHPRQTVVCPVPGVRVVNFPTRFKTFSDKLNALLAECRGEIVLPQDDDDVSLPDRAAQAVAALDGFDFWTPGRWWLAHGVRLVRADGNGVGWNCGAFRREKFLGRYPPAYADADRRVKAWALENVRCSLDQTPDDDLLTYVYRWGVSRYHFSGRSDLKAAYDEAPGGGAGTFEVVPNPGVDWLSLTRAACPSR